MNHAGRLRRNPLRESAPVQFGISRLIEAAQAEPQAITKRGHDSVVVLSKQEYERLVRQREPMSQFFARSGWADLEIERVKAAVRDEGEF
jgi:prevent-host-death family protein